MGEFDVRVERYDDWPERQGTMREPDKFAWIKNGPDVEKPKGEVLVRVGGRSIQTFVAKFVSHDVWSTRPGCYSIRDNRVTHFAVITEPDDG